MPQPLPHSDEDLALTEDMLTPTSTAVAPEFEDDKDAGQRRPMDPPKEP